ncbi:class I SAM-dependent methyltransferase [Ectobacillus panaciterrae]|uniref:class I SAM-dependent methyltransferase n=1 Tax=Ectobacillus panaciterrae TaxID=363872 RepID=UPI0003FF31B4|nr:class I SAM-dependent methyltransferase [Ectobacillus panaciterrae]
MSVFNKAYFQWQHLAALRSAEEVVPDIIRLIQPKSVIDIGCGIGSWLSVFQKYGIEDIKGIDGPYINKNLLRIPEDKFMKMDLTNPVTADRSYDLVLCLEVAECLPYEGSKRFIDYLVQLGPVILFSAAIPYQGGIGHINEQWAEFWARYFLIYGYEPVDYIREKVWNNPRVDWWYAQNMILYVREDYLHQHSELKQAFKRTMFHQLTRIHPKNYIRFINSQ